MRSAAMLGAVLLAACGPAEEPAGDPEPAVPARPAVQEDAPAPPATAADTTDAERRWRQRGIDSYDYRLTISCLCIHRGTYEVQVRDGTLASVTDIRGQPAPESRVEWILTVDRLFGAMRQAASMGTPVRAEYHPELGYPTEAEIGLLADDSGTLYRIENLTPR